MKHNFKEMIQEAIELYDINGVHPAAELPPMMSDDEFDSLVEDVKSKGFLHPVRVTSENLLIDGRNRLCASVAASLDVQIETYDPVDPIAYVLSENKRRHLTASQKTAMSDAAFAMYAEQAKERQREAGGWHGNRYQKVGTAEESEETRKADEDNRSLALVINRPQAVNDVQNIDQVEEAKELEDSRQIERKTREKVAKLVGVSPISIQRARAIIKEDSEMRERMLNGEITLNAAAKEVKQKKELLSTSKFNETNDNIEWAPYSWNPVTGCKMGCSYCYARDIGMRFNGTFDPEFHPERLQAPKNTRVSISKLNYVFVCSMADLFGDWVPSDWIQQVIDTVRDNAQWTFLFLTKNPKRYLEFDFPGNCFLGATADTQARADDAIDAFNDLNNRTDNVLFLSCEPLLEEITLRGCDAIDWVIIGGKSKNSKEHAFQPQWEWVEKLMADARRINAKLYFKPNLTARPKEYPEV